MNKNQMSEQYFRSIDKQSDKSSDEFRNRIRTASKLYDENIPLDLSLPKKQDVFDCNLKYSISRSTNQILSRDSGLKHINQEKTVESTASDLIFSPSVVNETADDPPAKTNNFRSCKSKQKDNLVEACEKRFICDFCEKRFIRKWNLQEHLLIHRKERPHTCETCGKLFRQRSQLNTHMRIHTNQKPFTCEICGKAFMQKGHLNRHLRIHTKEKQFTCEICGKAFILKGHLNRHERIHTNKNRFSVISATKNFP